MARLTDIIEKFIKEMINEDEENSDGAHLN